MSDKISSITGTITLADGSTSEFSFAADLGWQQWGAVTERLSRTVEPLEVILRALAEEGLWHDENDDADEEHDDDGLSAEWTEDDDSTPEG